MLSDPHATRAFFSNTYDDLGCYDAETGVESA
jgi:hypothetical protein